LSSIVLGLGSIALSDTDDRSTSGRASTPDNILPGTSGSATVQSAEDVEGTVGIAGASLSCAVVTAESGIDRAVVGAVGPSCTSLVEPVGSTGDNRRCHCLDAGSLDFRFASSSTVRTHRRPLLDGS